MISFTRSMGAVHVLAMAPLTPPRAKSSRKFDSCFLGGDDIVIIGGGTVEGKVSRASGGKGLATTLDYTRVPGKMSSAPPQEDDMSAIEQGAWRTM